MLEESLQKPLPNRILSHHRSFAERIEGWMRHFISRALESERTCGMFAVKLSRRTRSTLFGTVLLIAAHCGLCQSAGEQELSGAVAGIHDPSIIRVGSEWYVFGSGGRRDGPQLPIRCSEDSYRWSACGNVFEQGIPSWIRAKLPEIVDLWAPDISFEDGEYRLYYCYSLLGKNTSGIALLVNKTLDRGSADYAWEDRGMVFESKSGDDFNAIDPNFIRDDQGQSWLVFGSFWSGIKMRRLDESGKLSSKDKHMYSLAARARPPGAEFAMPGVPEEWEAIEGPFLVQHGEFFYLFTSWDHCCRGAQSNYHVMVGRSKDIKGPYLDETGKKLLKGGGTEVLAGDSKWAGPGGESVWIDPNGETLMVYHAYDRTSGRPSLRISRLEWKDDWPDVPVVSAPSIQ